ncbi:hypothetical protein [Devosia sp.]|uniref:hypothetical protein n=1 Tax=Devosia sp. TaxID=1871048 RepID=UPI00292F00BD|nr:hypothetical protein [Devosia sp.]
MNNLKLLGRLLQNLRDNRDDDEADIGPALLRETSKIFQLMVRHGQLSRDMFDPSEIYDPRYTYSVPKKYSGYQTTNYPASFVGFANEFGDWLIGIDQRNTLEMSDLIMMINTYSPLREDAELRLEQH